MSEQAKPEEVRGWGAVRRDQVADAKRGHPDRDLSGWAHSRGLKYSNQANASGYFAALPLKPAFQFNVSRGTYRDRDVCLWHWCWPARADTDNDLEGVTTQRAFIRRPMSLRSFVLPSLMDAGQSVIYAGVPCTGAAALVPEAALLPAWSIDKTSVWTSRRDLDLSPYGVPGFAMRLDDGEPLPEDVLPALLRAGLADVLNSLAGHGHCHLAYNFGTVTLRVDGYADEAGMDRLLEAIREAAMALATGCRSLHRPQDITTALPAAATWPDPRTLSGQMPPEYVANVRVLAAERAMGLEDPRAYHAAFPTCPVPGTALAVLRGEIPGLPGPTRIAVHTELRPVVNSGRTALVMPAGNAVETPQGGLQIERTDTMVRCAVRDGILAVWLLRHTPYELGDIELLVQEARRLVGSSSVPA